MTVAPQKHYAPHSVTKDDGNSNTQTTKDSNMTQTAGSQTVSLYRLNKKKGAGRSLFTLDVCRCLLTEQNLSF